MKEIYIGLAIFAAIIVLVVSLSLHNRYKLRNG